MRKREGGVPARALCCKAPVIARATSRGPRPSSASHVIAGSQRKTASKSQPAAKWTIHSALRPSLPMGLFHKLSYLHACAYGWT